MNLVTRIVPMVFVVLWSTGFIGAKLGLPYAEPFTFLAIRMAIVLAILIPLVLLFVDPKPDPIILGHSMVAGFLIHACYLGAVFFAISRGMSAGISSLIVGLQPLLTAALAWLLLAERITRVQIIALFVALGGVFLVLSPKLSGGQGGEGITAINITACFFSVAAISLGAVYQKRFVPDADLRIATAGQYLGAFIPLLILSLLFETREVQWSGEFIFALSWLVIVLSFGAVSLLMFLIRHNSTASTASLFYLVPVSTAIIAYFLFDETLVPIQFVGMAVVIAAVGFASRGKAKA